LKLPANSSLKFHRERINSWISRDVLEARTYFLDKLSIFLNPFSLSLSLFLSLSPSIYLSISPSIYLSDSSSFLRETSVAMPTNNLGCFEEVIAFLFSLSTAFSIRSGKPLVYGLSSNQTRTLLCIMEVCYYWDFLW